jgi:hypothetical protein
MNFLAPLFLVGAAAVGLPILFHLIRRTTKERKTFSSLMFLLPSPPRLTRRSKLEHILLLLLRCAVICLLAFGFARPYLKRALPPAQPAESRRLLLLLDTSASMRRADLWSDAKAKASAYLKATSPADQVAVFTFDHQLNPLLTFDQWNSTAPGERMGLARAKLEGTSPGWSDTHLGSGLMQAAEIVADTGGAKTLFREQIVLISDLAQGSHAEPLQGYEWPKGLQLSVEQVQPKHRGNATLQLVPEAETGSAEPATAVRVRVSNSSDSQREQFRVGWAGAEGVSFVGQPALVYVPPGQSRVVTLPLSAPGSDRILLTGDENDFDNTLFVVPPETQQVKVIYLGNDPQTDAKQPLYFLERAFQQTRGRAVTVVAQAPEKLSTAAELNAAPFAVVADSLPDGLANSMHERVTSGTTVLFLLRNEAVAASLARVLGIARFNTEEVRPSNYALLSEIDFRHPILAPFSDPRFSDFTKIHFWKYRKMEEGAIPSGRVMARFDSGDPALIEAPLGKGRVLILTSGWQPEESQLALSSKFVPLLYSILEQSGVPAPIPPQFQVSAVIPLGTLFARGDAPAAIRRPDGSQINLSAGQTNFAEALAPGVYTVSGKTSKRFAVNLEPAESLTVPLPVDELERLGAPVSKPIDAGVAAERKARLANAELENRQKLWRWLVASALVVLLGETWLGGRTARKMASPAEGVLLQEQAANTKS